MAKLTEKLTAYASGRLDDDEALEIEALLIHYVDGTLDPAGTEEIERAIGQNSALAAIVAEAGAGKHWFDETLAPALKPLLTKAKASPELQHFVEELTKRPSPDGDRRLNAMPGAMSSLWDRKWYALAASIVLALLVGGWGLNRSVTSRLDVAQDTQLRLEQELADATARMTSAERDLIERRTELEALRSERSDLRQRLDDARTRLETASRQAEDNMELRAALDEAMAGKQMAAANSRRAIDALEGQIAELGSALTRSSDVQEADDERLAKSDMIVAAMRTEAAAKDQQIGDLQRMADDQAADLKDKERQVAHLEAALSKTTQQIAELETFRQAAKATIEQGTGEPGSTWTRQVAGYYSLYARQPRRHLVEVRANERNHIERWLQEQLGRDVPIPDLSEAGMEFQGARLLAINGMPVAQLTYLDAEGEPLAFCFMRNMERGKKDIELSSYEDLHLADWSDQAYQYVIIGSTTFAILEALAQGLGESYGGDI